MRPLPHEYPITEMPGQVGLILTSHRVRYDVKQWGHVSTTSIMLDEVASCGLVGVSHPLLLVLAPLVLVLGLASSGNAAVTAMSVVGAVALVVTYVATRRRELSVTSAGDSIRVRTGARMTVESAQEFLDAVEAAKDRRYVFRYEAPPVA